jgi:DNA-damage-inducible protein D
VKRELINDLFSKFEQAKQIVKDIDCWSARALQSHLGYSDWLNFLKVIEKSKLSCENADGIVEDHFVDITKMVDVGSGAQRPVDDIILSRYACYLIAQNGDPAKSEIAFAQTYFAVQTRKQEIIEKRLKLPNDNKSSFKSQEKLKMRGVL